MLVVIFGASIGAICGVLLDLLVGRNIGTTGILLAMVGFVGGAFDKNFSKDSKITIILMVMGTTFVYEILNYIINILFLHLNVEIIVFLKILIIEMVYQFLLTIILYPIMKNVGYFIERIYKGNNILTRYF